MFAKAGGQRFNMATVSGYTPTTYKCSMKQGNGGFIAEETLWTSPSS
jgi:hypothetical protein